MVLRVRCAVCSTEIAYDRVRSVVLRKCKVLYCAVLRQRTVLRIRRAISTEIAHGATHGATYGARDTLCDARY
eukprot:2511194-Rhodomonas_salina.1